MFDDERSLLLVALAAAVVTILIALALYPSEESTIQLLQDAGYSSIELHGYAPFACSEDDVYRIAFTATSQRNSQVSGTVCSAPLKGSTIRFNNR